MSSTAITTLPNELLTSILTNLTHSNPPNTDIPNLRLVSRRFNALASPFLIPSTSVSFTSSSLNDLERLANLPDLAKGVRKVEIIVSYYEAWLVCKGRMNDDPSDKETEMVRNEKDFWDRNGEKVDEEMRFGWERFVENCATNLRRQLHNMRNRRKWLEYRRDMEECHDEDEMEKDKEAEGIGEDIGTSSPSIGPRSETAEELETEKDRCRATLDTTFKKIDTQHEWLEQRPRKKAHRDYVSEAVKIPNEWRKVNEPDFKKENAAEKQRLILSAYEEYVNLFEDQEHVVQNGDGIKRLVKALEKFPALREIAIQDLKIAKTRGNSDSTYARRLRNDRLKERCLKPWKWSGTYKTAMFTSPPTHWISGLFTTLAETDARPTRFNIKLSLPKDMRKLRFSPQVLNAVIETVSRAKILHLNIDEWSQEELAGLGDFSKAFFSSSEVKELHMSMCSYFGFNEIPKVSLAGLLVLSLSKPHLSVIIFQYIPIRLGEMHTLVNNVKGTLKSFLGDGLYLLNSNWKEGIEVLRGLQNLEELELRCLRDGIIPYHDVIHLPTDLMREYVLRQRAINPLTDWEGRDGIIWKSSTQ
jgi:hypothetical protein